MRIRYRNEFEDDDKLFDLPIDVQRRYVADCIGLGPGWANEHMWVRFIDLLISVRRYEGKGAFYLQIGCLKSEIL